MLYMATFTINIPPMLAYIPYMDPMGSCSKQNYSTKKHLGWSCISILQPSLKKFPTKKMVGIIHQAVGCGSFRDGSVQNQPDFPRHKSHYATLCHTMPGLCPHYLPIIPSSILPPSLSVARFSLLMFDNVNPR
jgi:hypothetical protein